jgi:proteasome accessory factor B
VGSPDGFVAPPGVDPNDYLSSDPLTYGDDQPIAARVLVDAARSSLVVDALGEDAVVEQRDDGSVVVALAVVNREAFRTFVLDLLEHAEVLEPPELRAEIVGWLSALADERVRT